MDLWMEVLISALFLYYNLRCVGSDKIHLNQLGDLIKASTEENYQKQQSILRKQLGPILDPNSDALWPFDDYTNCGPVNTRDQAKNYKINKATSKNIENNGQCGINMFIDLKRREAEYGRKKRKKRMARSSTTVSRRAKAFIGRLERLMENDRDIRNVDNHNKRKTLNRNSQRSSEIPEEIDARIVGGVESEEGKFPWVVSLGRKSEGLNCGGTLLTDRWVLTAAHCFQDSERLCEYNVRVGSFNWLTDDGGHHMDIEPELVVKHKDFDEKTMVNDIALLKLSKSVPISPDSYINNICFPEMPIAIGTECVAAGWGVEHEGDKAVPSTLREVTLSVIERNDCSFNITSKQFCAGSQQCCRDTCQGDSGGPLMTKQGDRWYLVGVTSFGYGCGRPDWPGIYTDVYCQRDFISSVINRY